MQTPQTATTAPSSASDVPVFYVKRVKSRTSSGSATTVSSLASSLASSVSSSVASSSPLKRAAAEERSRLRKLVSLSYYSGKVKHWLQRDDRDTFVCEEDEEDEFPESSRSVVLQTATTGVAGQFYTSWIDSNQAAAEAAEYEPSKEQRWCTNCTKCFHRKLSHYDQFCGLDCKTAHRFRLAAA